MIPAAETEFARDKTFGYKSSDLPGYIEEKSGGRYKAEAVICIPLEELRAMELDKIEKRLLEAGDFQKIVVNAIENVDVEVFCIALYRAIRKGKHYLFRTAAAFVKAVAKIRDRPLLGREEMLPIDTGVNGVIIIGSHTEKDHPADGEAAGNAGNPFSGNEFRFGPSGGYAGEGGRPDSGANGADSFEGRYSGRLYEKETAGDRKRYKGSCASALSRNFQIGTVIGPRAYGSSCVYSGKGRNYLQ